MPKSAKSTWPDYITKLISNLLANAIKFTPEYGRVSITMWRRGNTLLLDIIDTGKGMDKELLDHAFELFYQAEGDTQNIGTGIGLALVKQIVDAINGTIAVESTPGAGTAFHISLPIHNSVSKKVEKEKTSTVPLIEENTEEVLPLGDDNSNEGNDDCRILVVEDNHDIADYIGSQLKDFYHVYYAFNGQTGMEKALEIVPDLIITDLMMPEMNGLELCRQVRDNDIINHVPIIIITAKASEEERIKGLQAGADAYMTKPFNTDELQTRVAKLLENRKLMREKFTATIDLPHQGGGRHLYTPQPQQRRQRDSYRLDDVHEQQPVLPQNGSHHRAHASGIYPAHQNQESKETLGQEPQHEAHRGGGTMRLRRLPQLRAYFQKRVWHHAVGIPQTARQKGVSPIA